MKVGPLDRRITVEIGTATKDAANGQVFTWAPAFKRWARKRDLAPAEKEGASQTIRESDTVWVLRDDSQSRAIFPENHRFVWKGKIFEIVGVIEGEGRADQLHFTTCSRPDGTGPRGRT